MLLHTIESVLSLLLLIAVGFYITGKSWFGSSGSSFLSKFTVSVAIPCYMTYNVINTCETRENLINLFKGLPIPFFTIITSLFLGLFLAKIFSILPPRRGVFVNAVTLSNTVIIGFPVVTSLFGEEATPFAMIYYMANTILFWTVGTYLLRQDGSQKSALISKEGLKKFFSPPIIGFIVGVVIVLSGVQLPEFIFSPLSMLKDTTTPLAMIFIGSILRRTDYKKIRLTRDLIVVLIVRFIVSPAFMALVCSLLPIDLLMKQVFFVLATMPAMTQLGIMAKESDSDVEFASVLVTVTTTVSMFVLPIYVFIMTHFQIF